MHDITFLSLNFDVGGSQRHTLDLARSLQKDYGLSVRHIGTSPKRPSPLLMPEDDVSFLDRRGLKLPGMFMALFEDLHRNPSKIIVAINQPPMTTLWLTRLLGVHRGPTLGIFHTTELRTKNEERSQLIHTQTMKRLDHLVFVSEVQREYWAQRGLSSPGTRVIVNGISVEDFENVRAQWRVSKRAELKLSDDDFVIGLSARFRPEKNHRHLVEAVAGLRAQAIPAVGLFIGNGPTQADCIALAESLGVMPYCLFVGEHEDVRPFLSAVDVGVLCSQSEAMSLAALEIMMTGVPLVLSRVGGASEIVEEGFNGYLFDVGDTKAFIRHLTTLAKDRALLGVMGQRSLDKARNKFSYDRMVREYFELFKPLLA